MRKTWRYILGGLLYAALTVAAGAYFWAASGLREKGKSEEVVRSVKVTLLDSSLNKFVTKEEIVEIINRFSGNIVGRRIDSLPLNQIEALLNHRSVVKESQAFVTRDGVMSIEIRQRKPVVRIQTPEGGFYMDETAFVFPLIENYSSYVPVVTGNVPFELLQDESPQSKDSTSILGRILDLGIYLEKHPFWNAQIEEIFFNDEGEVELIARAGNQRIIFGDLDNIAEKFDKLHSFYSYIIPKAGWDKYSAVNLKYRGQIVCTKKK